MLGTSENLINFKYLKTEIKDVKIFFGEYDGIQRFDRFKYPISDKLSKVQQSSIWFPKEINFSKDIIGIKNISSVHEEVYRSNLLFQTLADSLANRFLDNVLTEYITSPEWERVIKIQSFFEGIHSEAYSENVRKVYSDAEKFFNDGFKNKEIQHRLDLEVNSYSGLKSKMNKVDGTLDNKKEAIVEVLLRQYALENIRFFISFLYTFQINEVNDQVLQGSVNNIALILNDEIIHTAIFKHLINILKTEESEEFIHLMSNSWFQDLSVEIFKEVINSEMKWFEYLSNIAEFPTFNERQIKEFLYFYSKKALDLISIKNPYESDRNELINFFESKKNINGTKAMAQETNLLSYNIGVLEDKNFYKDDLTKELKKYNDYLK